MPPFRQFLAVSLEKTVLTKNGRRKAKCLSVINVLFVSVEDWVRAKKAFEKYVKDGCNWISPEDVGVVLQSIGELDINPQKLEHTITDFTEKQAKIGKIDFESLVQVSIQLMHK